MSKVSYPKMASEGGKTLVLPTKRYGDPFTKGDKIFLCKKCNKVWQYEVPRRYVNKTVKFGDWFPKLQPEKTCPECEGLTLCD